MRHSIKFEPCLLAVVSFLASGALGRAQFAFTTNTGIASITGLTNSAATNLVVPGTLDGLPVAIAEDAFKARTNLVAVTISNGVLNIGQYAFSGCSNLASVSIPGSVTNIGEYAFADCSRLDDVAMTNGLLNIGPYAFASCVELINLAIPDTVTNLGNYAFTQCTNLSTITIGQGVATIGTYAFNKCASLTGLTIPGEVRKIGNDAFYGCSNLVIVTIGGSVTNIGTDAFEYCKHLIAVYFEGNAPSGTAAFAGDSGVTVYYYPTNSGFGAQFDNVSAVMVNPANPYGTLQVTITPPQAVAAGAEWQIGTNALQTNGAIISNLTAGSYSVSFSAVAGWNTPPSTTVTVTNGMTTFALVLYTPTNWPESGLLLLTNGNGTIAHPRWPASLFTAERYRVIAHPAPGNVFIGWIGGTAQPYSTLSASANYLFTMEPYMVLEAEFATNVYLASGGTYRGLFGPEFLPRQQTNSGSFQFTVTSRGVFSGRLDFEGAPLPIHGQFNANGLAKIVSDGFDALTVVLQLDFAGQSVSGTVSGRNFTVNLSGDRDVFTRKLPATNFESAYTMILPGTTNPVLGPYGASYATVRINSLGVLSMAGSLADGTAISQSTVVSKDGYWPLYVPYPGDRGSLWGWALVTTNQTIVAATNLSWIKTSWPRAIAYPNGFTNQTVTINGGSFQPGQPLPADWTAVFTAADFSISNTITESIGLHLGFNKNNGIISGTFSNPDNDGRSARFSGVLLHGQTNAAGYFFDDGVSGSFSLEYP